MSREYKPKGYNSVSPYFIVNGTQKLVDLLTKIFNAKEKRCYDMPDGTVMHMEIEIDDSIIMLGEASEQYPANTHLMHVYVPDVDAIYNKAISLGCVSVEPPKQRDGDPDRRGSFKDFAGNFWSVGTQL